MASEADEERWRKLGYRPGRAWEPVRKIEAISSHSQAAVFAWWKNVMASFTRHDGRAVVWTCKVYGPLVPDIVHTSPRLRGKRARAVGEKEFRRDWIRSRCAARENEIRFAIEDCWAVFGPGCRLIVEAGFFSTDFVPDAPALVVDRPL